MHVNVYGDSNGLIIMLNSAGADGGPRSWVCAHLTLRSAQVVHIGQCPMDTQWKDSIM